ncbi:MAG: antitoxin VbhA family protein [Candidatus Lustribacter sp.]
MDDQLADGAVALRLGKSEARSTDAEAFAAGLVALRAAGLEPSDYAKELAARVIAGEISVDDMEAALLEHHGLSELR